MILCQTVRKAKSCYWDRMLLDCSVTDVNKAGRNQVINDITAKYIGWQMAIKINCLDFMLASIIKIVAGNHCFHGLCAKATVDRTTFTLPKIYQKKWKRCKYACRIVSFDQCWYFWIQKISFSLNIMKVFYTFSFLDNISFTLACCISTSLHDCNNFLQLKINPTVIWFHQL